MGVTQNESQNSQPKTTPSTPESSEKVAESKEKVNVAEAAAPQGLNTDEAAKDETDEGDSVKSVFEDAAKSTEVKYELKLPENSLIKEDAIAQVTEFAKANGLSNEAAQALLNGRHEAIASYRAENEKELMKVAKEWQEQIAKHPKIGGENWKESQQLAIKTVSTFGSPELLKDLQNPLWGNYPHLVEFLVNVGKKLFAEDRMVSAEPTLEQRKQSQVEAFFPKKSVGVTYLPEENLGA